MTPPNNMRRAGAALLSCALALTVLLSCLFVAAEADHDCEGDGCPVCELIQAVSHGIDQGGIAPASAGGAHALPLPVMALAALSFLALVRDTPHSLGVRLDL